MKKCYICGENTVNEKSVTVYRVGNKAEKICDKCLKNEIEFVSKCETEEMFCEC